MNIEQFIQLYRSAPATIRAFEELRDLRNAQIELRKQLSDDSDDAIMLDQWIEKNTDNMILQVETYNRCKFLLSKNLTEKDIEELRNLYNNIYGN